MTRMRSRSSFFHLSRDGDDLAHGRQRGTALFASAGLGRDPIVESRAACVTRGRSRSRRRGRLSPAPTNGRAGRQR
jgi:hypothetical protein